MTRFLLDTGPLAAYLNNRGNIVSLVTPWIATRTATTSALVYGEVVEHLHSLSGFAVRRAQLRRLLRSVHPYALTYAILERYALIRRQLRPPYGPGLIGDVDTLIAATALERNLTVVTMDSDYGRVPNLAIMLIPRH